MAPLLLSVASRVPLVVPTATLPNLRLAGLTEAAEVTVSLFDFVMPLAAPEIVA
jgi:hypothetical protein